ncbi:hypothetical protein UFOVP1414_15 [uncultured Caudovirales phage]|uniref:Uncharacterized protein n=1 Tax=uncultured Caudovirales phage TaxID=2100421 RepID=A0A6J5MB21_9CAUD|nr:hypothetical protein UFOVP442_62 [uncultured Caudovirales phage]CAB4211760.1 hypothetical protein UFOVP1414_15 [uncultured Caudovirales phage]
MARASKLLNDPDIAALVASEVAKALAARDKADKAARRGIIKTMRETTKAHASDAKQAGNKDAAMRLHGLGGDLLGALGGDE